MDNYFGTILTLILTKLQNNPADSFKLRFARFYHLISSRPEKGFGADYFCHKCDQLDDKVFAQVYPPFVMSETGKLARPVDRKAAVVSLTKTICDSQVFAQRFAKGWATTCRNLLALLVNPPTVTSGTGDEIMQEADVDEIGFGTTYTALNTCRPSARDEFPEIQNIAAWVKEYVVAANQRHSGAVEKFISERLGPEEQQAMVQYLR